MPEPRTKADKLFRQRLLSCSDFYTDTLDGIWGPNSRAADQAFERKSAAIAAAEGTFDPRSEKNISGLRPDAQELARKSLMAVRTAGIDARIISGTRTYAEQDELYRQGRSRPGRIVTNAQGGQSWHNFGLAWDIGIFVDGAYQTAAEPYKAAAAHGKVSGVSWGGDWLRFKDFPHYFQTTALGMAQLRARFEKGCR
ncbi:M15 family metallopeptidase [Parasphingopyxis algicola]|uniref:M15 family metallopeptidase n=1 Tax=Parasphingopyxis algicola TaxID=2026624 RepID=UPI0015A462FF|nr:M15 family metallopeptidase [Parasphingopyxis algicola]QLC26661.1 M15 family metallopeptidase [Parasphingopyxis algicola]